MLLIILLIPLRPLLIWVLRRVGHGELFVLYGFLLALGGAELFDLVGPYAPFIAVGLANACVFVYAFAVKSMESRAAAEQTA